MDPRRPQVHYLQKVAPAARVDGPSEFGSVDLRFDPSWGYPLDRVLRDRPVARWIEAHLAFRLGRFFGQAAAPCLPTLLSAGRLARADVGLAVLERDALLAGRLRSLGLPLFRRTPIVAVSIRLAETIGTLPPRVRNRLRRAARGIDVLVVYSPNQVPILSDALGIPTERVVAVPFGIDTAWFSPERVPAARAGGAPAPIVAAGRDLGRDYATLFDAVRETDLTVTLLARPHNIAALDVPAQVQMVGFQPLARYRAALAAAEIVVIPVHPLAYPSGSTVLLHGMALERCCVVTGTPALAGYVDPGRTAVVVPPGDADALRRVLVELMGDPTRREAIGRAARAEVSRRFDVSVAWARIGEVLERFAA